MQRPGVQPPRAPFAAGARAVFGHAVLQHIEHGLAPPGACIGGHHGCEVDGVVRNARRRRGAEAAQVGRQRLHLPRRQGVARHQRVEGLAAGADAVGHRPGQGQQVVGRPGAKAMVVQRHAGGLAGSSAGARLAGAEQVTPGDGRGDRHALDGAEATRAVALHAGDVAPAQRRPGVAPALYRRAVGAQAVAVEPAPLVDQRLVGRRRRGAEKRDQQGEQRRVQGASIGRSSARICGAWASPSRRTHGWPGARRRKVSGVWPILSGR